jgi:hypothetical protein
MDIRVINSDRKIVNVSRLSLEAQGKYVVGLTDEQKQVLVESCLDEQEAERLMESLIECIKKAHKNNEKDILIDIKQ